MKKISPKLKQNKQSNKLLYVQQSLHQIMTLRSNMVLE